jgi:transposase
MSSQYTDSQSAQSTNLNHQTMNDNKSKNTKSFPKEFKEQVIGVYKSGVYDSIQACAKAYGVSNKTLYSWLRSYEQHSTPAATSAQQTEIANLKKELAKAKMEVDILKKAAIYFANQAR